MVRLCSMVARVPFLLAMHGMRLMRCTAAKLAWSRSLAWCSLVPPHAWHTARIFVKGHHGLLCLVFGVRLNASKRSALMQRRRLGPRLHALPRPPLPNDREAYRPLSWMGYKLFIGYMRQLRRDPPLRVPLAPRGRSSNLHLGAAIPLSPCINVRTGGIAFWHGFARFCAAKCYYCRAYLALEVGHQLFFNTGESGQGLQVRSLR